MLHSACVGLSQSPPMQNIEVVHDLVKLFLIVDKMELKNNGVWRLQAVDMVKYLLNDRENNFSFRLFVSSMIKLNTAVQFRCNFSSLICSYVNKLHDFFRMTNYVYNRKSPCSMKPNKQFTYNNTELQQSTYGLYYPVSYKCDHLAFYNFIKIKCSSDLSPLVDPILLSYFSYPKSNNNNNNSNNDDEMVDLFPKRNGGEYSFSKRPTSPPPLPEYKLSYGFDKESHFVVLNNNRHLFDEHDRKFILHPVYDKATYKRDELRRLLLKYHPDKNITYAPVSAMLISKCRALLKKCVM